MNAITKLQELYDLRDSTNAQIAKIEALLGTEATTEKPKRTRGPNKPKTTEVPPPNEL